MIKKDKSALIIGAAGFVGGYLCECLLKEGAMVFVTKLPFETFNFNCNGVFDLDITDPVATLKVIEQIKPDEIYHLAAQSSVAHSWKAPKLTVDINIGGVVNILEACRNVVPDVRILLVGSAEEYGHITPDECPIREEHKCAPQNVYALTKNAQNMLGTLYCNAYGMNILMVRAFNHFGPRQLPQFVISDFCRQVAQIEVQRKEPVISVGNLEAKRDFTDVRDIVRAYAMITEYGKKGETYNVGSGNAISIREMLDIIIENTSAEIKVVQDPARMRPSDVPIHCADISKIKSEIGWTPQISYIETICNTLEYWRNELK